MPNFESLPFNRVAVFDTPVFVGSTAVRTGTIDDPLLSFFTSILYACSKKFILTSDPKDRIKQVNNFKDYIFDKIHQSKDFATFNKNFSDSAFNMIKHFYNFIENDEDNIKNISKQDTNDLKKIIVNLIDNDEKFELYQLITELIPISSFAKIFNNSLRKWSENFIIKNFETLLMKESMKYLKYKDVLDQIDIDKVNFIKKNVLNFLHEIIDTLKKHFIEPKLPTTVEPVVINTISNYFDCDIYFIDSMSRLPFISENYNISNLKSIIILSFDNKQYEIVGKKLKNNVVQREFMPFDDIIKTIKFYLDKENKVGKNIDIDDDIRELINGDKDYTSENYDEYNVEDVDDVEEVEEVEDVKDEDVEDVKDEDVEDVKDEDVEDVKDEDVEDVKDEDVEDVKDEDVKDEDVKDEDVKDEDVKDEYAVDKKEKYIGANEKDAEHVDASKSDDFDEIDENTEYFD